MCPGSHTTERRVAAKKTAPTRGCESPEGCTSGGHVQCKCVCESAGENPGSAGFCVLFRALGRSRKKATAVAAKAAKGGKESTEHFVAARYPKMEPRGKMKSEIQRLVLE